MALGLYPFLMKRDLSPVTRASRVRSSGRVGGEKMDKRVRESKE